MSSDHQQYLMSKNLSMVVRVLHQVGFVPSATNESSETGLQAPALPVKRFQKTVFSNLTASRSKLAALTAGWDDEGGAPERSRIVTRYAGKKQSTVPPGSGAHRVTYST